MIIIVINILMIHLSFRKLLIKYHDTCILMHV